MPENILILGAGYAGIEAALTISRKKAVGEAISITIIDKNLYHTLSPSLYGIASGRLGPEAGKIPLGDIFRQSAIKVIIDEVKNINFKDRQVITDNFQSGYKYDYLIIATGNKPSEATISSHKYSIASKKGLVVLTLGSIEDAVKINDCIERQFLAASREDNPQVRMKLLHFVIAGGGPSGIELAGELGRRMQHLCRRFRIARQEVNITLLGQQSPDMTLVDESERLRMTGYLEHKYRVRYLPQRLAVKQDDIFATAISSATANTYTNTNTDTDTDTNTDTNADTDTNASTSTSNTALDRALLLDDGSALDSNTIFWTVSPEASISGGRHVDSESVPREGRFAVNEYGETEYQNVYAVGDMIYLLRKSGTRNELLPTNLSFAISSGKTVAKNILASIRGNARMKFDTRNTSFTVSAGATSGIASVSGISFRNIGAYIVKHLSNITHTLKAGGIEYIKSYIANQLYGNQSIVDFPQRHRPLQIKSFWLLPLRLLLGYSWLKEGLGKIYDGWLKTAILSGTAVAGAVDASKVVTGIADTGSVDAVSSATIAAGEGSEKVFRIISENTPIWYKWIAENLILPNSLFFQWVIVLTEIALGIAIITGTLTFFAALGSIAMNINFMLSTGFSEASWWFIPTALVLIVGGGRALSVDFYLSSWLSEMWKRYINTGRLRKPRS